MFDAGSGDMMGAKGAIVPVSEVFKRAGLQFNPADFIPPARGYYGLPNGDLLSMPFNVSTTVLFYNKDLFKKAGLDAEKPPKTWPELMDAAKKLRSSNAAACGYTTTWLAWVMLEQFSSRHNVAFGTQGNGRNGLDACAQRARHACGAGGNWNWFPRNRRGRTCAGQWRCRHN